ncbi:gluconolaconase [Actinoplanes sp. NPDC051851]|uniref:PQQ-dependent sugar dehydrogenase n=1 Tax=Actinoplanes sp. NPDC051851 TaxID=3154753 RepID=UPI00341E0833
MALAACSAEAPAAPAPSVVQESGAAEVAALVATDVEGLDRQVMAPPGWTVELWSQVPGARLMAWTPEGTLLVSRPKFGDVVELTPGDAAPENRTLISGLNQPHGLAFAGDTLYLAESDQVNSFTYQAGKLTGKKLVVGGLPDKKSPELGGKYAHALKSVAVGQDGAVYVSVGSTGNVSEEDRDATPERASILRVPPGGGAAQTFARGVRNGTGLAVAPDGAVWTAVNHRDNVEYPYDEDFDGDGEPDKGKVLRDYVNEHPFEQLARLEQGRDLGWPYCNPDPDVADGTVSYTNRPFIRDLAMNGDGAKLDCASLAPTEQGMGAHSAPLGLTFVSGLPSGYGDGALVGIHGSWNRKPPRAPEVSFFAWKDGAVGPQQTLLSGFQLADGSRWGRPVMAVMGPDKAIYVSDDYAGAIYRVTAPA